ncbi:MAG: uracil-DNA glycosylase, partial [Candidatus Pacearchaeota archaeon]|nr:uracil-DNA glycosylase [Candidatus Pacearchaeota archaeon]
MKGFFTLKETQSKSIPDGKRLSCSACGLYKDCLSPQMEAFGNFKKKILIIGEAPGEIEDKNGKPWQGKTGRLLQRTLQKLGLDLFEDCLNINACLCRPMDKSGENRAPYNNEILNCRQKVLQVIEENKPEIIIPLGNSALQSLLGNRWKKDLKITRWRGWTIPDRDFNAWICPTFHPSFIERSDKGAEEVIWTQDLERIIDLI